MRTIRAWLGCAVLLVLLSAHPGHADPYPPAGVSVVPGVAIPSDTGLVTFTGGGFAPRSPVKITVNGSPRSTTTSTSTGAFFARLDIPGSGADSLAASGPAPGGGVHVVTATFARSQPPSATLFRRAGAVPVYEGLLFGLTCVAVVVALLLGLRLLRRVPVRA